MKINNVAPKGVFITATDTGVGKTYIASLITGWLSSEMDLEVGVFKPFLTGSRRDALLLMKAAGIPITLKNLSRVNPCFLKHPLAPFVSAKLENRRININKVIKVFEKNCLKWDFVVVEGAGGLLVPIKRDKFMIDLIKIFNLPVIVVARPSLGTINHTLLSIEALRNRGIKRIAVVVNNYKGRNLAEKTNVPVLKFFLKDIPVFVVKKNSVSIPKGLKLWLYPTKS